MLSVNYLYTTNFSIVADTNSFFREKLEEIQKIKLFINSVKVLASLPTENVVLWVAEGERIYKVELIQPGLRKISMGWFIYLPLKKRVDLYLAESPSVPTLQWKNKKLEYSSLPLLVERLGVNNTFNKLINIL